MELEKKKEEMKLTVRRRTEITKIRAGINEMENRKIIRNREKSMTPKAIFFRQ